MQDLTTVNAERLPICSEEGAAPCGATSPLWGELLIAVADGAGHLHLQARVRDVLLAHAREDGALLVDTYRHGHPRRSRPGERGAWLPAYQLADEVGPPRPVALAYAPCIPSTGGRDSGDECLPAAEAWKVIACAHRESQRQRERAQWIERALRDPTPMPTRSTPEEGEAWRTVEEVAAAALVRAEFFEVEEAGEAALAELLTNAHGARGDLADLVRAELARHDGPVLLDARALAPLTTSDAIVWLGRALEVGRGAVVAFPPEWPAATLSVADRLWARR